MLDLNGFEIILASSSPRRKAFLESLNIPFSIKTFSVDETFPPQLQGEEIAQHIVRQKNAPYVNSLRRKQIVITADTIVWCENRYLGKPENKKVAREMLKFLSGNRTRSLPQLAFSQTKSLM